MSDTSGQIFKDALKEKYLNEGHSVEWVDSVLNQINLTITSTNKSTITRDLVSSFQSTQSIEHSITTHDKTKYGFLGSKPMSKRKFVLNVVRHFVAENPKSYAELSKVLNALRPDSLGVIKPYDSLEMNQYRNYFVGESEYLRSEDGIKFVVCNQWGIFNIGSILQFANSQGYNVVEYK